MYENDMFLIKDLKRKAETVGPTELISLIKYDCTVYVSGLSPYAQLLVKVKSYLNDRSSVVSKVIEECESALNILALRMGEI